jgi:peroxiredoxin family protein
MYESPEGIAVVDRTPETIDKVSIIVSRGSLDAIYPGLIMANGARMEGIEANVFFTFFGMEAIRKKHQERIKIATVGNPGLHLMTWLGGAPGMSALVTRFMRKQMAKLDIPPIPEFIEMISDSGAHLYACKASVEMFDLEESDFVPQVEGIVTIGEFYEMAGGGQVIFT